jgi:hypothetical protein
VKNPPPHYTPTEEFPSQTLRVKFIIHIIQLQDTVFLKQSNTTLGDLKLLAILKTMSYEMIVIFDNNKYFAKMTKMD